MSDREGVRSDCITEYIKKGEDELEVGFLDRVKVNRRKPDNEEVQRFWLEDLRHSIEEI